MRKIVMDNETLLTEVARLVEEGETVRLLTKGNSMLPFIRGGKDSVMLVKADDVHVCDIVLARVSTGGIVLHRVIAVEDEILVLMGDGNVAGKEVCKRCDVMAKAVAIIRDGDKIDCTSAGHMRRARIWAGLLPVRRYLLALYRRLFR